MDGAGVFAVFTKIVMPLSVPIMATVGLMTAIGYWNDWTNGLYYLTENGRCPVLHDPAGTEPDQ